MWGTLLSSKCEDYSVEDERAGKLENSIWILFNTLRDEGKQYPLATYMIPNTRI